MEIIPNIIELIDEEPRVSHIDIAEYSGNKKKSVQDLITRNIDDFKEFGDIPVHKDSFVVNRGKGEQPKVYFLNEKQTNFLFIISNIPAKLSLLFAKSGSSFKAILEFAKLQKAEKKEAYVYIIEFDNGNLKIGYSTTPTKQFRTLETQSGNLITKRLLLKFGSKEEALKKEKSLHRQFSDFRLRGEYFSINFETATKSI